ncbi:MAG: hypothetical protein AAGI28_06930 [Pseudomonadota bacterium]
MKTICYSRIKLSLIVVMALLFLWGGFWMVSTFDGKGVFLGSILILVMGFAVVFFLRYLADNTIAKIGHNSLEFHGLLGTRTIRYDRIIGLDIETTSVNFFSQRHLAIKSADESWSKTRISEMLLEKRAGGLEGILDMIANTPDHPESTIKPARRLDNTQPPGAVRQHVQRAGGFGRKVV